ncbi:MAG TPA: SUMF1/EgtB/PvdO family nonheme iron enzyme, partial [Saprospiraceae bacterium]|nr:SUMF1/EgtB/PvdO family nonheme iron enzyme [Saprospiraceae bacterium]
KAKKEKEEEVAKRELEQKGKLEEAEKREKVAAALLIEEKAAADLREKELAEKKAAEEKENQREVERQIKAKKEKEEEVAKRELEQKRKLEEVERREKAAAALLIEEKEKVAEIVRQNQLIALNEKDDTTYNEAFAKNKIGPLKSYLTIFPQGLHINEARIRIDELKRDKKPFPLWWVYGSVALIGILLLTWFGINHYKNKTEISTYEINGLYGYYFVDGDTITKAIFNSTEAFKDGKGVAFINDSMYTVEKDGTFIFTPRSVEVDNVKALTLETINEASLEKLYSLSNTFPNDPLISEVKKRIQELEKSSELNEFEKVKNSKEIKQLEAFLIKHPSSKYSKQIKDLIVELSKDLSNKGEQEFFDIAKSSNSKTLVIQYLQKYPKGKFTQEAKSLLDKITNEENRQIWDQARVNLSPDKISSFIKSNPNSPFIEDAKKLLQQLNKENQMQLERSAWEGARASNSLDQLNSFILKYPLSANVKDAKALIKNLESKSTEPIKPEPKKEETKEDNCAPILAAINQGYKSIPGGSYTLNGGDKKSVGGFALSQFEITQEQYKAVMGDKNPSSFKDQSDLPVESISYSQIREFLNKLNSLTCNDFRYRLPTVAEWEYAALGGKNDLMYAGSDDANEVAVYGKKKIGTQKVGTRKANGFGLYDMSGNVAELCSDKNGITRKGGSWNDSKAKIEIKAGVSMPAQSNDNQTGFRLVREKK